MPPAKHRDIEKRIRALMRRMEVGAKLPAVATLAQDLGVSPGTVHRAIESLVQEGALERRPNRGAFVSRPGRQTTNIGVIWSDIVEQVTGEPLTMHPYTSTTLHAVQEEAARQGRNVLLTSNMDPEDPQFIGRTGEVGGVIILHNYERRLVEAYHSRGIPVVLVDPLVRVRGVPFVTTDHHAEFHDATQRLIEWGHEHILHLTVSQHLYSPRVRRSERVYNHIVEERARGFREAMAEAGHRNGAHVVRVGRSPWKPEDTQALGQLIAQAKPTACLSFNDDVASSFIGYCGEHGLRVPDDISVMGHDDTGLAARLTPSLTSIHIPLGQMGREAARLLAGLVEEETLSGPGLVLPGRIEERASTCQRASDA